MEVLATVWLLVVTVLKSAAPNLSPGLWDILPPPHFLLLSDPNPSECLSIYFKIGSVGFERKLMSLV